MNKEKYDKLDKRHDELIGEFTDLEWDIMWNLSSLIEIRAIKTIKQPQE